QDERGFDPPVAAGEIAAVAAPHAEALPLREGLLRLEPGEALIEAGRQAHPAAPAFVAPPAKAGEVIGDRGEDVLAAVPDGGPPVAAIIRGIVEEARRDEPTLPHGAGPRAEHCLGRDVAMVENAERRHELAAEEARAPSVISERRQRRDHREAAAEATEIRLDAPECHDETRLHVIFAADLAQE